MAFTPHGNGGNNSSRPSNPQQGQSSQGPRPQGFRPQGGPRPQGPRPQQPRPVAPSGNNKDEHRINERIRGVREVRLVGDNVTMGIYTIQEAMRIAEEQELDLVEISPTAQPPVCKVMDYQKFCYQQKKKAKEAKANAAKVVVKEIRFGPQTGDADYEFKLRHAKEFIAEGDKVKAYVFFKGRSILFKEQGEVLLARFANDLSEIAKPDSFPPVLEGKRMILMFSPKAGAGKKKEAKAEKSERSSEAKETVEIRGAQAEPERDVTETNPLAAALAKAGVNNK